jgi:hypothetical protein
MTYAGLQGAHLASEVTIKLNQHGMGLEVAPRPSWTRIAKEGAVTTGCRRHTGSRATASGQEVT